MTIPPTAPTRTLADLGDDAARLNDITMTLLRTQEVDISRGLTEEHRAVFAGNVFKSWNSNHMPKKRLESPPERNAKAMMLEVRVFRRNLPAAQGENRKRKRGCDETIADGMETKNPARRANAPAFFKPLLNKGSGTLNCIYTDAKSSFAREEFIDFYPGYIDPFFAARWRSNTTSRKRNVPSTASILAVLSRSRSRAF